VADEQGKAIDRLTKRIDLLDQRLDSIDTMITAVAERVMSQPITLMITCPHCKKNIEVTIIGSSKPSK